MGAVTDAITAFVAFEELMSGTSRLSTGPRMSVDRLVNSLKDTHGYSDVELQDFLRAFRIQMKKLKIAPAYTHAVVPPKSDSQPASRSKPVSGIHPSYVPMREELPELPGHAESVMRQRVIRLAYSQKDLRGVLLPLVRQAGMGTTVAQELSDLLYELATGKYHKSTSDKHAMEMMSGALRRVQTLNERELGSFVDKFRQITSRRPIKP